MNEWITFYIFAFLVLGMTVVLEHPLGLGSKELVYHGNWDCQRLTRLIYLLQWGSEIRTFKIWVFRPDFKWPGFQRSFSFRNVPNHLKLNHPKSGHFCPGFKQFLTKLWPFVRISNGWASGFQTPFEIRTICKPTSFQPIVSIILGILEYNYSR